MARNAETDKAIVDYLFEVDNMTTTEFCDKFGYEKPIPLPCAKDAAMLFIILDSQRLQTILKYAKKESRK